jgi:hypothetical protein
MRIARSFASSKHDSQARAEVQAVSRKPEHFLVVLIQQILSASEDPREPADSVGTRQVKLCVPSIEYRSTSLIESRTADRIDVAAITDERAIKRQIVSLGGPGDFKRAGMPRPSQ